tara:strand:+ start:549 stop:1229 length:681 start_codon:yes stop_codon:yes gene_type:complete
LIKKNFIHLQLMVYDKKIAKQTAKYLLQINAIKLNTENCFQWASGWISPIYCDNRLALSFPEIRSYLTKSIADQIISIYGNQNIIAGVATGAIGIGALVANELGLPFIYVRPEPKKHGRKNQIEGVIAKNKNVIVVEDLISTGMSSLNAIDTLKDNGMIVKGMISIFTYGFNFAIEKFKSEKIQVHSLSSYDFLINQALKDKYINSNQVKLLNAWKKNPSKWNSIQ